MQPWLTAHCTCLGSQESDDSRANPRKTATCRRFWRCASGVSLFLFSADALTCFPFSVFLCWDSKVFTNRLAQLSWAPDSPRSASSGHTPLLCELQSLQWRVWRDRLPRAVNCSLSRSGAVLALTACDLPRIWGLGFRVYGGT